MLDEKVPENIPEEFKKICIERGYKNFPEGMRDETASEIVQQYYSKEDVRMDLERVIRRLKEMVFLYHGLS